MNFWPPITLNEAVWFLLLLLFSNPNDLSLRICNATVIISLICKQIFEHGVCYPCPASLILSVRFSPIFPWCMLWQGLIAPLPCEDVSKNMTWLGTQYKALFGRDQLFHVKFVMGKYMKKHFRYTINYGIDAWYRTDKKNTYAIFVL